MVIAPAQAARIARALWIAWAIVVWNVIFDHIIVVAGRRLISAAGAAGAVRIDEFMQPAITRGIWTATAAASAILIAGVSAVQLARNR
jgi:hypothetical protein